MSANKTRQDPARRMDMLRQRLQQALRPEALDIEDDSAAHAGHAGARGGGHFNVTIVSARFVGQSLIKRHRMVYDAVADMMDGEIHALSMKTYAPDEV